MKRIGILTFHRSINYGAFLQAYSLAKKIHEITGCKAEIIDYEKASKNKGYKRSIVVSTDLSILGPYRNYKRYLAFKEGLKRLPLSSETLITDDYGLLQKKLEGKYDILITGSDAIFNYNSLKLPNPYWLDGFNGVEKMSYAASAHGMDFDSISSSDYAIMSKLLDSFNYIGARDEETIKMIKKANSGLTVYRNCDPSVFLNISQYNSNLEAKIHSKYKLPTDKKLIGLMVYDRELGKRIRERYGDKYLLVSIYRNNPYADIYLYDLDPFEWSHVFSKFELLITKYFHGTLFSLKNTTPTISIDYTKNVDKYNTKLKDLLTRLGLSECYFMKKSLTTDNDYDQLFDATDRMLTNPSDIKHKILMSLSEEAKYSDTFFEYLSKRL